MSGWFLNARSSFHRRGALRPGGLGAASPSQRGDAGPQLCGSLARGAAQRLRVGPGGAQPSPALAVRRGALHAGRESPCLEPAPQAAVPLWGKAAPSGEAPQGFLSKKLRTLEALNKEGRGSQMGCTSAQAECCWKGPEARAQGARRLRPRRGC